jgi:hypothetical protein
MQLLKTSPLSLARILAAALVLMPLLQSEVAFAASLTALSDTISSSTAEDTGVDHDLAFTTATTDLVKRVGIQFSTTQGGATKPAALDLSSVTLGTVTGLGAGWSLVTSAAGDGLLYINRASAQSVAGSTAATIPLSGITNSAIDDCQSSNDILQDTCHVRITTYSDDGTTAIDMGDTSYTVQEDPHLSFEVEDVSSGASHNGVTSNITTSSTSIAFGRMGPSTSARYGTQKITITTNAPHGYKVYARLTDDLKGVSYVNNTFDPFGATSATWATPQNWSTPNGLSPNSNSGWLGANTSDTRVAGWSSGSGKFGPFGTTEREIAKSDGPDRGGSVIYISYAVQVNILQASDNYAATILYDIRPIF